MIKYLLAMTVLLAACDDGVKVPTIEETVFNAGLGVNLAASTKTASGMYYRDISVGSGATVVEGSNVAIHYTGYLADATIFDINQAPQVPFPFTVGQEAVIAGVDEGVRGMQVGGVRQLIIPPNLGYGGSPRGPIPANSILVFNITIASSN